MEQNNSGIYLDGQIPTISLRKAFEQCYAVNVFGASITAEAFLPLLKKSKAAEGPKILNISSPLGSNTLMGDPNGPFVGHYFTVSHRIPPVKSRKTKISQGVCIEQSSPQLPHGHPRDEEPRHPRRFDRPWACCHEP